MTSKRFIRLVTATWVAIAPLMFAGCSKTEQPAAQSTTDVPATPTPPEKVGTPGYPPPGGYGAPVK
jgi:hypothetical protein